MLASVHEPSRLVRLRYSDERTRYRCSSNGEFAGAVPVLGCTDPDMDLTPAFLLRFTGGAEFGGRFFPLDRFPFADVASITARIQ